MYVIVINGRDTDSTSAEYPGIIDSRRELLKTPSYEIEIKMKTKPRRKLKNRLR